MLAMAALWTIHSLSLALEGASAAGKEELAPVSPGPEHMHQYNHTKHGER